MFQFFESLLNIIKSVVAFFVNTANSVIDLFVNVSQGLVLTSLIFQYLPGFLQVIFVSLLGIAIVKLVLSFGQR